MPGRINSILQHLPGHSRQVASIVIYGLAGSLAAVAFHLVIHWIYWAAFLYPAQSSPQWFPWISLGVITLASLAAGVLLTKLCPEAAGSGIPQLKLAFWKDFGASSSRLPWVKFIASALSVGGGQSLGREGPSVQLGGSLASSLAGRLGVAKQKRRTAAATGAAAGLAAAFNAPLAAVAFVLEEILEDLNSRLLGPVLLAALTGAFVVHALLGAHPAFVLPRIEEPTWRAYALMPLSAGLATLAGVAFQRGALGLRRTSRQWIKLPPMWRPLVAGWITWALGMTVYHFTGRLGVFGLGHEDLSLALTGELAWKVGLVLLVAKLTATVACYGLGGAGGIFTPSLFFGAMCGLAVAGIGSLYLPLNASDALLLTVGGMSACLGAVVQAPVTALLIIFEMTHQFALVPGLMIAGLISQLLARRLSPESFYEAVLAQDGHRMDHVVPPRDLKSWQGLPISAIAQFEPVTTGTLQPAALTALAGRTPYHRFPVVMGDKLMGVVLRKEILATPSDAQSVPVHPVPCARPYESILQCQERLIESVSGMIVVTDREKGIPLAVVTLHDLLRAQTALSDREGTLG